MKRRLVISIFILIVALTAAAFVPAVPSYDTGATVPNTISAPLR